MENGILTFPALMLLVQFPWKMKGRNFKGYVKVMDFAWIFFIFMLLRLIVNGLKIVIERFATSHLLQGQ